MFISRRSCLAGLLAMALSVTAQAATTVKDDRGGLTLDRTPQRIVALEFSFVDALANVGITPVGIADDNDPKRLVPQVSQHLQATWKSVGTRSQPNMETISALKPDLIIADTSRHGAAHAQLSKIAPVLLLNSRYGTLDDIVAQARTIGAAVGRQTEIDRRIDEFNRTLDSIRSSIPAGQKAVFGASREDSFNVHSSGSFTGGLLTRLGFELPAPSGDKVLYDIGLEQLLAINPDWMFVAHYRQESLVRKWEKNALWPALTAARKAQVEGVDPDLWARARGLYPAEAMAEQVREAVGKKR